MNATTLKSNLSERAMLRAVCAPRQKVNRSRLVASTMPARPCRTADVFRTADSAIVRRLDTIEGRQGAGAVTGSSSAELRRSAQDAAQARGERIVFAILATGSIALLAAAGVQGLQMASQWTAFLDLMAGILA
jgi:hypothetical protein